MQSFTYENTTRIHFGEGQISQLRNDIPKNKKVLVVYDNFILKTPVRNEINEALKDHKIGEFSGIEANPQYDILMKAVKKIKDEGFDYILAVGGGSVIDGCKFIAAAVEYKGDDPWDICDKHLPIEKALPLSCVLTIPASGTETNTLAVISRGEHKILIASPKMRPLVAVIDPKITLTLPPRQMSNGVVDAFIHVMEQYLTYSIDAKIQDRFSEGILLTLMEDGPKSLKNPEDLVIRSNIIWAATQALSGLIGVGVPQDWTTHLIGHEVTGNFNFDHARTLAVVLPAVMKVRRKQKESKILQYAERVLDIKEGTVDEKIDKAIEKTIEFFKLMDMPTSYQDLGLSEKDIEPVLKTFAEHNPNKISERGDIGVEEVRTILEATLV